MKRIVAFISLTTGLVAAAPALADDAADDRGLYLKFGAGASFANDLEQDLSYDPRIASIVTPPSSRETAFDPGVTYAAAVGFHYPLGTRTELEYRHERPNLTSVVERGGFSPVDGAFDRDVDARDGATAQLLMSNFYKDFDNDSAFTPYLGAGVGGAFVSNGLGERDAEFAWQVKAGVGVDLGEGLFLDVEYAFARSGELEYGPKFDDFDADTPISDRVAATGERYQSSTFLVALRKEF